MTRSILLAVVAVALPAAGMAQAAGTGSVAQERAEIQQRLQELQAQVTQEPEVQAAQVEVGALVMAAMERVDPSIEEKALRAQALQQEAMAARAAEDEARLRELSREAEALQAEFARIQAEAMRDEETRAAVQRLQERILERMTEIDPEAPALIVRLQELQDG